MTGFLGQSYLWVKAAHLIFVIFWMAGLFMLPRYLVYHQEGLGDPAEEGRWLKREAMLKRMILTPSLVVVWALGLALAVNAGLMEGVPGLGWLHAKLALVIALSGYHGWALSYARKLQAGKATLANRSLRMINEVPAIGATLIVILAIVKPF